jgi:hypothetical protein
LPWCAGLTRTAVARSFTKENQKELLWKAALDKAADRPKERWAARQLALCETVACRLPHPSSRTVVLTLEGVCGA